MHSSGSYDDCELLSASQSSSVFQRSSAEMAQALKESLAPLKKRVANTQAGDRNASQSDVPIELRLAIRGVLFKMDHHPMEVVHLASPSKKALLL